MPSVDNLRDGGHVPPRAILADNDALCGITEYLVFIEAVC